MSRITCTINGTRQPVVVKPGESLREMLVDLGHFCVRDSDNGEGFAGSDTVIVDDMPVYANLMMAVQADGKEIRTPDGLGDSRHLSIVQQAMIDAGVVQSAYNAPEAALLLTWLLEHTPHPTKDEVKQVLSGIFIRDAGYERYYLAVRLAAEMRDHGRYTEPTAPSFRENLHYVGKPMGKVDGPQLVSGERSFV
ncbi:MAG: 2Fe-2S iron-sulfur cluster-binding protein [Sphaerochaetaceae bacterium]